MSMVDFYCLMMHPNTVGGGIFDEQVEDDEAELRELDKKDAKVEKEKKKQQRLGNGKYKRIYSRCILELRFCYDRIEFLGQ